MLKCFPRHLGLARHASLMVFLLSSFDKFPVKMLIEFNLVQIQRQIPQRITASPS